MPATRGLGSPDWSPQPDFQAHMSFERTVDERVFQIYNERDVQTCLLESDPQFDAYKWLLSESEINTLALDSARAMVQSRKELLLHKQLELARAARKSGKLAVVAGTVENLKTGEITSYATQVPMGRAFG